MGFTDLFIQTQDWKMVSQDDGTEVQGQFPPSNLRHNVSGVWAEQATVGLPAPVMQFVNGASETIQCDVKIWAKHQGILGTGIGADDIEEIRDIIEDMPRKDTALGRPHVWLFSLGSQFSAQVVVTSVGGIRYDRVRAKDGTLRGVLFSLDMARYEPFRPASLTEAPAESLVVLTREGETFEHIARRTVGDARLGEALRRRNPDKATLQVGDQVHVPPAGILRKEVLPLRPQSVFFKTGDAQRSVLKDAFDHHAGGILSHVVLTDFN